MGKAIVISGADFAQNGVVVGLDFTQMVADAGNWYPQHRNAGLASVAPPTSDTKRCCILRFNIYSIPNYTNFSKIRLIVADGFDYVFSIGDSTNTISSDHWQRVTGIETYDSTFSWITNNQQAVGALKQFINLNLRYDNNTTEFPANAKIEDYIRLELIN